MKSKSSPTTPPPKGKTDIPMDAYAGTDAARYKAVMDRPDRFGNKARKTRKR